MNAVTKPANAALGALGALKKNLANVRARIPSASRDPYLRLLKDGEWVFGQEDHVLKNGTEVIFNTLSIQHGFSCWSSSDDANAKNELLGEVMVPLSAMPPTKDELPDHGFPWKDQLQMDAKVMTGTHKGKQITYKASSVGGLNAAKGLLDAIMARLDEDTEYVFPIVQLGTDNYRHKKWGKTYTPVFDIVGWANIDGQEEDGDEGGALPPPQETEEPKQEFSSRRTTAPEPEPEQEEVRETAPARRRAAAAEEPAEEAPVRRRAAAEPEEAAPVRRRR